MQVLYAMSRDREMTFRQATLLYDESIRHSFELYLFNLYQLIAAAEYAEQDYSIKSAKHRPTTEDKAFFPKLSRNSLLDSLRDNKGLSRLYTVHKIQPRLLDDNARLLYNEYAKSESYRDYLNLKETSEEDHQTALLELYKICVSGEMFNEIMEDNFISWADDKSLVVGAVKKTLKALPVNGSFYEEYIPAEDAVKEFGESLLNQVNDRDAELLELIEPTLKNWDAERVAILDMILLKMAVTEFIAFPSIPTKVTLNEYVEISKLYSTDKSKDFINGILDRLLKKLTKDGRIEKSGRGLIDE